MTVGYLLDSGAPAMVPWLVAVIFALAILTAVSIRPGPALARALESDSK